MKRTEVFFKLVNIDHSLLPAALEGLELQRKRIEDQIAEVRAALQGGDPARRGRPRKEVATVPAAAPKAKKGQGRVISQEGRARIAEAQRKRWEAFRQNKA